MGTGGDRGGTGRIRDLARLERLRVLLEDVTGARVTRAGALDASVEHMLTCLGEGSDRATFSVSALRGILANRTRELTAGIAQAVSHAVTEFLRQAGHDAELIVGLSGSGERIAAKVVTGAPLPLPIGDDRIYPTIEA